jgi:CBS-domain-containing membrane protein
MKHRKVVSLMAMDVAVVSPDTPFKQVARMLASRRVNGMPVVDAGRRVLGVVSTADLLINESRHEPRGPLVRLASVLRWRARAKARATVAGELMTAPAITVGADADVVQAARLLEQHKINRLPVVDGDGRLLGIVGRAELLRVFLRPDEEIAAEIVHEVFERELGITVTPATVQVKVRDGVVTMSGELGYRSQIPTAVALARRVDGVIDVLAELTWHVDDQHGRLAQLDTTEAVAAVRRTIR